MPNSPTIVSAALSDKELQDSINKMVANFDKGLQDMLDHSNKYVEKIQESLQKIGSTNFGAKGSNDGGVAKQTKAQNADTDAIEKNIAARDKQIKKNQEAATSFDNFAKAQQVAIRSASPSGIRNAEELQTMNIQLDLLRERLREARQQYSSFVALAAHATTTGDKGLFQYATDGVHRYEQEVRSLIPQIRTLQSGIQQMGDVIAPQGHTIQNYVNSLQKANPELAALNAQYKSGTSLLQDQSTSYASATQSAQRYTEEIRKQISAITGKKDATKAFEQISLMPSNTMDEIKAKGQALVELVKKVKDTPLMSQSNVKLAEKMIGSLANQYRALKEEKEKVANTQTINAAAENTTRRSLEQEKQDLERLKSLQEERRQQITQTGIAAQQQARILRESIGQQMQSADYTKQVDKVKELQNALTEMKNAYKQPIDSSIKKSLEEDIAITQKALDVAKRYNMTVAGLGAVGVGGKAPTDTLAAYSAEAQRLAGIYKNLSTEERSASAGQGLKRKYQELSRTASQVRKELERPINLKDAMKGGESTIDDLAYKIQRLQSYKRGLDFKTQAGEIQEVDNKVKSLNAELNKYLATAKNIQSQNTALGRSWNYMKNRLAFYFTVGASTQFVRNLIEVRSQYEMNERALGILIDSAERGTQIFNELSQMALVSPYTLIELSAAAKQLTAYDIAAKDVVDTTRRLADMASAVGIPIERLTYALGQIKAYGYLNSRDARMFSNAGIPLVKQLSEYYTELEGRMVSTADVYDRMKKKAIDYSDVMSVINKMTDEGGKFFDFQAKMADTLKVRLANLTLAWNNMLNDIGESHQGWFSGSIELLKETFLHWQEINKVLRDVIIALGAVKGAQLLVNLAIGKGTQNAIAEIAAREASTAADYKNVISKNQLTAAQAKWLIASNKSNEALRAQIVNMKILTVEQANAAASGNGLKTLWYRMGTAAQGASKGIRSMAASLSTLSSTLVPMLVIGTIVDLFQTIYNRSNALKEVNAAIVNNADESAKAIKETLSSLDSIYKEANVSNATQLKAEEQKKAWELLREQIELSASAANYYIQTLLQINNMGVRVNIAKELLESIERIHGLMSMWHDDTINVTDDFKVLGIGADGLSEDLSDFQKYLNAAGGEVENLDELSKGLGGTWRSILAWVYDYSDILAKTGVGLTHPIGWLKNIGDATGLDFLRSDKAKLTDAYKEVLSEIEPLSESLQKQILRDGIKNANEIKEVVSKTISSIATERQWSEEKTLYARLLLEKEWGESSNAIFRNSVADRQTAWDAWLKFLTTRHKTEFSNMGNEEISAESWAQDKRKKLYEETFQKFKEYNVLAANQIENTVNNLNQLQVRIKVYYDEQNQPSWLQQDFKKRVPSSNLNVKEYKTLSDLIAGEQKALKDSNEEMTRLRAAGVSELDAHFIDVKERARQATEALDAYNAEHEKVTKKGGAGAKKDPLGDALAKEVQLIGEIQKRFAEYRKMGVDAQTAMKLSTDEYGKTLTRVGNELKKFGITTKTNSELATMDLRGLREEYKRLLTLATNIGNAKGIEALEKALANINVEIAKVDYKRITDSLNSELGKLKDEYELAVELDANPELGDMFADMFGINTSTLPKTFGDALDRAQTIINRKLAEMKISTPFDLMEGNIDSFAKSTGLDKDSAVIKELVSAQNAYRDMFKKNITETEKVLDDYIKKYGDYSDKIAEIEAGRLEKLKKLNEAYYTEEMRKRPEYVAKLNAIEQGAKKEKQQVDFDEFKNSRYYTMMFENLDYISTKTIRDMRDRVRELMDTMNDLTPEQLKTLMSQYEKLEQKLVKRSPFKTLTKDLKEYFATSKERKAANQEFKNAQKEYDAQKKNVAALKEKYEQAKANSNTSQSYLDFLQIEINSENEILKILKEQLEAAQKKADKYNLTAKLAKSEALAVAQVVGQNLQSLGELRDFLQQDLGIELSDELNGLVDGLSEVGQGINKITSSATSGDIVGVITGVGQTIYGLYDGIASIFGGGSTSDKKITKQIQESERAVKRLENAYKQLEYAAENAFGAATSGAQEAIKANKELQLVELKRQLALEQSRDSKHRDEDRIIEIRGQIIDLEHEIKDFTKNAVNDLLGISSHGDFFESMISEMIEAFKNGEDAMEVFEEKWSDMIDNMIMKTIVSQVLSQWVKTLEHGANEILEKYTKESSKKMADLASEMTNLRTMDAGDASEWIYDNDRETFNKILESLGVGKVGDMDWLERRSWFFMAQGSGLAQKIMDAYLAMLDNNMAGLQDELDKQSLDATGELIDYYGEAGKEFKENYLGQILDKIQENWNFGQDSEKQLSNLQQGIQGITEDTAGALESYMNGVSQQVYYHSSLLEQIRDSVVGLDLDASLGVQSQMLLQLQNSYQTQQAIQQILEGVLVPSGRAFAVELLS